VVTPRRDPRAIRKDLRRAEYARVAAAKDLQRFGLAHADMRIALATVRHLQSLPDGDGLPDDEDGRVERQRRGDLRFAIESAITVIYARPFQSPVIGSLGEKWVPTRPTPSAGRGGRVAGREMHTGSAGRRERVRTCASCREPGAAGFVLERSLRARFSGDVAEGVNARRANREEPPKGTVDRAR
jgi:hypothetical protein